MFNFNGKSAKDFPWLRVKSITGSILPPLQRRYITVPSKPGAYHAGRDVGIRREVIVIKVNGDSLEGLMEKRRFLADWLDTEETAPFFYDHEPTKVYRAVLSEETNLDQILYYGEAELIFEMPDPYATSAEVKSALLQGHIVREIFGDWSRGTLTDVVADGSDLRLAREGEDVAGTIDGNWETGTHNNTAPISDGDFLQLAKTGEDFIRNWEDQEAWESPENNRLNTGSDPNGNLRLIGLPEWEFVDLMTDYTQNWRVQSPTAGGTVTQHDGYVTIKGQGVTSNFGIDTQQNSEVVTVFPCTIFFKFRGRDTTNARFIIEDGSSIGYTHQFDDEANEWAYYWIRCGLNGATVYRNGLEIAQLPVRSGGGVANQIQFDIQNEGRGDFDIGPIYIDWWYDKGPPPETGWWDGLFETPTFELSQVGTAQGATLNWAYGFTGSNPDDFQIDIEYQIDGGSWQPISDNGDSPFMEGGAPIPEIAKGDDLTGKTIKLRAILKSRDPLYWPYLERLHLSIPSAYHTSGYWDSEPVDLSPVGRARQSFISWVADSVPAGTSVKIYTRFDFGTGWTSWEEVSESGSMVPGIDPDTDLTTAQFQCRVELLTDDIALTPSVDRLDFGFRAAYVPSGEWMSPPIPLEEANEVGDSIISWNWNEIEGLTVETRLNGGEWQPATNGGEIPGARGTEGATLEVRLTLSTSDASASPIISRLEVLVREAAQTEITYEGSAPGLPRFHVEVTEAVEELRITHLETGKFILLQGSFQPGDEIEIDHEDESIRLNGIHRLTFLNINSRFFKLAKGVNRFEVSPKFGPVVTMEWAERWK